MIAPYVVDLGQHDIGAQSPESQESAAGRYVAAKTFRVLTRPWANNTSARHASSNHLP